MAALVLVAAVRLAARNVDVLMDRAPCGLDRLIEQAVRQVPGVAEVRSVRVREAGGESFADVVIGVSRLEGLERSHQTMDRVEEAVQDRSIGPAQVTVHVEPIVGGEAANERVAAAALRVPGVVETHNITVLESPGRPRDHAARAAARGDDDARRPPRIVERLKREIRVGVRRGAGVSPTSSRSALGAQPARDVGADEPELVRAAERRCAAWPAARPRWWSTARGRGCWW